MSFKLGVFRPLWGVAKAADGPYSVEEVLPLIKRLGYTGVEAPLKMALHEGKDRWVKMLEKNGLKAIYQIFSDGPVAPGVKGMCEGPYPGHPAPGPSVDEHVNVFKAQVTEAMKLGAVMVNSHSIKDYFTFDMAEEFFKKALEFQKAQGAFVCHETHRKRFLHSPWVCRDFLDRVPALELVADLSHFTCVAETNPEDPELTKVIRTIAPRVRHIHARVGYDHGPQVSDPRSPEWLSYTQGFEKWWDMIFEAQKGRGSITLSPEHGPPNYQQTIPYTRQPLASIWEINHWLALRQVERFAKTYPSSSVPTLEKQ